MAFNTISEFIKTKKNYNSVLKKYGIIKYIEESIGPENDEKLCHFAFIDDEYIQTAPHIDIFNVEGDNRVIEDQDIKCSDNILLSNVTLDIDANYYNNDEDTLDQYFLEYPTRDGIQYLIWWRSLSSLDSFEAFVPGLLYSDNGKVLGFLHSHVADDENKIKLEVPYIDGDDYYIDGEGFEYEKSGNIITIDIGSNNEVMVELSDGTNSKIFFLYSKNYSTEKKRYRVKDANEYGDYTIAAQLTRYNSVKEVLDVLSEMKSVFLNEQVGFTYLPKTYRSLALIKSSESVKNISLSMYKVPAAFVKKGDAKIFMTDVTGIAANKIIDRN